MCPVLSALLDAQHAAFERGDWATFDLLGIQIDAWLQNEALRTEENERSTEY